MTSINPRAQSMAHTQLKHRKKKAPSSPSPSSPSPSPQPTPPTSDAVRPSTREKHHKPKTPNPVSNDDTADIDTTAKQPSALSHQSPSHPSPSSSFFRRLLLIALSFSIGIFADRLFTSYIEVHIPRLDAFDLYRLQIQRQFLPETLNIHQRVYVDYYQLVGRLPPRQSSSRSPLFPSALSSNDTSNSSIISLRGAVDNFMDLTADQCAALRSLIDGSTNTRPHPRPNDGARDFDGLDLKGLDEWRHELQESGNGAALADIEMKRSLLLDVRKNIVQFVRSYYQRPNLWPEFTHLVRHNSSDAASDSAYLRGYRVDNCVWKWGHGQCEMREDTCCSYREYSAVLYLDQTDGGEITFHEYDHTNKNESHLAHDLTSPTRNVAIAPACGRLVFFHSGPDNLHAVRRLKSGQQYSFALWMTDDRRYHERPDVESEGQMRGEPIPPPMIQKKVTPIKKQVNPPTIPMTEQTIPVPAPTPTSTPTLAPTPTPTSVPIETPVAKPVILPITYTPAADDPMVISVQPYAPPQLTPSSPLPPSAPALLHRVDATWKKLTGELPPRVPGSKIRSIRGVVDNFMDLTTDQCESVAALMDSGYTHVQNPYTERSFFGMNLYQVNDSIRHAKEQAVPNLEQINRLESSEALLQRLREGMLRIVREFFNEPELWIDYTHLTRRQHQSAPLNHGFHADNCRYEYATGECHARFDNCCAWRSYSALLYLNEVRGGEFVFEQPLGPGLNDSATHPAPRSHLIPPTCGRVVFFSSGGENIHGVRQIEEGGGNRYALAVWFTSVLDHSERPEYPSRGQLDGTTKKERKNLKYELLRIEPNAKRLIVIPKGSIPNESILNNATLLVVQPKEPSLVTITSIDTAAASSTGSTPAVSTPTIPVLPTQPTQRPLYQPNESNQSNQPTAPSTIPTPTSMPTPPPPYTVPSTHRVSHPPVPPHLASPSSSASASASASASVSGVGQRMLAPATPSEVKAQQPIGIKLPTHP